MSKFTFVRVLKIAKRFNLEEGQNYYHGAQPEQMESQWDTVTLLLSMIGGGVISRQGFLT